MAAQMEVLEKLKPAEGYIIRKLLEGGLTPKCYKQILKLTVVDLLTKQVLKIRQTATDDDQILRYVCRGKQYVGYQPRPFEKPFVQSFSRSPELELLLPKYIRTLRQSTYGLSYMTQWFRTQPPLKPHFERGLWISIFGTLRLNEAGQDFAQQVNQAYQQLGELIESPQAGQTHGLVLTHSAHFMVINPDMIFQYAKMLDELLEQDRQYAEIDDDFLLVFDLMDMVSSGVDASDSDSSGGGCSSGDGGDGGCGGGGCGGCGGCGS